jgi:hypothetical protein
MLVQKKYLGVYLDILYSLTKFHKKKIFFVACAKKEKNWCSKIAIYMNLFVFFTHAKKKSFLRKTLWVNIKYSDIHKKICSNILTF